MKKSRKNIQSRSSKVVLMSAAYQIFALGVAPTLFAQSVPFRCVNPIAPPPPPRSSPGTGYQPAAGPSEAEIAAQQRQQDARNLNDQGVQYGKKGQWKLAADCFKAALDQWPDNQTIRDNYQKARDAIAAEEAAQKQQQQEQFDKDKQDALSSLKGIADNDVGLKGLNAGDDFGLKGVDDAKTTDLGLKGIDDTKTLFDKGTPDSAPVDTRVKGPSKLDASLIPASSPSSQPVTGNSEPPAAAPQASVPEDLVKEFLFPGNSSVFPKNPDQPLLNPLIERAKAKNLPVRGETADAFYARFQKSDLFTKLDQEDNSLHPWNDGPAYPRGKYPAVDKVVDETLKGIQERETGGLRAACQNAVKQMNAEYASMEQQGIIHPGDDLAAKEKNDAAYQQALMHARHRVYEQFQKDVQVTLIQHDTALDKLKLDIPKLQEANQSDVEKYLFPASKQ